jgi:hypothetical protein
VLENFWELDQLKDRKLTTVSTPTCNPEFGQVKVSTDH